jgi:hypothetical protein
VSSVLPSRRRGAAAWLSIFAAVSIHVPLPALAQTWVGNGTATGDFNTANNWSPATVPTGNASPTFATSPTTTVTATSDVTVGTLNFQSGASSFNFQFSGGSTVTLQTQGISINGGTQQFNVANSTLSFINSSSATTAVITADTGGVVQFNNTSSASQSQTPIP